MERFVRTSGYFARDASEAIWAECPIFLRPKWFELFDKYVRYSDGKTRILGLRQADRVVAELPVYLDRSKRLRTLHSLTNFYSPAFRLQSSMMPDAQTYLEFVKKFYCYFACFDRINMVPLLPADAFDFRDAFSEIGFHAFIYRHSTNWYHDEITSFGTFWTARPSRLKNTLTKKSSKLAKIGGFSIRLVFPDSRLELWKYLGHFHQVYSASWKRPEPYPAFLDAAIQYAWERNELRLGLAYHNNVPVAAQVWFVCGTTAYIFKLAYRREYAQYSIGSLLSKNLFEYVIREDQVSCIDYLTGNDLYKKDWMAKKRPLYGIHVCNPNTWRGAFTGMGNQLSRVYRRIGVNVGDEL